MRKKLLILFIMIIILTGLSFNLPVYAKSKPAKKHSITCCGILRRSGRRAKGWGGYYLKDSGKTYLLKNKDRWLKTLSGKNVKVNGITRNSPRASKVVLSVNIVYEYVEIEGTLQKYDVSIYFEGSSYFLISNDKTYILDTNFDKDFYEAFLGKTVLIKGFARPTIEGISGHSFIVEVKSINKVVTISGTLEQYDGYYVQIVGYSIAYLITESDKYTVISQNPEINLFNLIGNKTQITGLLLEPGVVLIKSLTII